MQSPNPALNSIVPARTSLREKLAFARSFLVVLRETRLFDPLIDTAIADLDEAAETHDLNCNALI